MLNKKTQVSKIISENCCGSLLPIDCPKSRLVALVEDLENENKTLKADNKKLTNTRFIVIVFCWLFTLLLFANYQL